MRKTKAKRDSRWEMLPFVVVWAISSIILGRVSSALMRTFLYPLLTSEGAGMASNFIPVIVTGLIQVILVERLLKRSMRGWMLYTVASAFITIFLIHIVARSLFANPNFSVAVYMLVNVIAYNVPAPVLQFFWLRRRVNRAWLWPVISILFMFMFSLKGFLSSDYSSSIIEGAVRLLAYGIIQAGLMHHFWQQPKDTEKAKIDIASDEENARIERLQESDLRNPLWDVGDNQALQSEA